MLGGLLKNRFSTSGQAPYRLLLLSKSDPLRWAPDLVLGVEFNTGASKVFAPAKPRTLENQGFSVFSYCRNGFGLLFCSMVRSKRSPAQTKKAEKMHTDLHTKGGGLCPLLFLDFVVQLFVRL